MAAGFAVDGAWQGNVAISGGTLRLMQSNVFANGSNWTINSPGQFNMNGQGDAIGNITGNGSITNNGGLTLDDLAANATFSGNISGGGAIRHFARAVSAGRQTLNGGTSSFGNIRIGKSGGSATGSASWRLTARPRRSRPLPSC